MRNNTKRRTLVTVTLSFLLAWGASPAWADISHKQVRTLISRMAGMNLPKSDLRIIRINQVSTETAEATAELQLVFRMVQRAGGRWQISEVRTGQDQWEDLGLIADALKISMPGDSCSKLEGTKYTAGLTVARARCLVADLFKVELPSDAVRIKEISTLGLPAGTETSALAVSLVQSEFRLRKVEDGWQVTDFRTGNHDWISMSGVSASIDQAKRFRAMEELKSIAQALSEYRKQRGAYVVSDKHRILIDHLSPTYLKHVIRLDPWHHPYQYQGDVGNFTLRSAGPDGKADSSDDIVVSGPLGR